MSNTANWSYTNTATVWPITENTGGWDNENFSFGEPYQIACTWKGGGDLAVNQSGNEFVSKMTFYHEDARVKAGDWIAAGVETDRLNGSEIKAHTEYDMSFFNEAKDFMSIT